jgi:hypothetical protein
LPSGGKAISGNKGSAMQEGSSNLGKLKLLSFEGIVFYNEGMEI